MSQLRGIFEIALFMPNGRERRRLRAPNTVVVVGQNFMLQTVLTGSGYTVTGPYMGMISSLGAGITANDTMTSHAWVESASTIFSARQLANAWGTPVNGSIQLSTPASFLATGSDTINGAFMVLGAGAAPTPASTAGTLLSAATFPATSVSSGMTLQVSYSFSVGVVATGVLTTDAGAPLVTDTGQPLLPG
jgi:hypothetical protein